VHKTLTFPQNFVPLSGVNAGDSSSLISNRDINKVLLIQPPAFTNNWRADITPNPPLGVAYIAAVLEQENYDVSILDAFIEGWDNSIRISEDKLLVGLSYEEIYNKIEAISPDVVGITSMFTAQRKNVHAVAMEVKKYSSEIPVIVGGAHATAWPEELLIDENIDAVILGEGENSVIPLLDAVGQNKSFTHLDGIAYRDANNQIVVRNKTIQIADLDDIPFPARHLLPMEKYFAAKYRHGGYSKKDRAASMITSRGCQYLCNFCTAYKVFTRRPRMRSIQNVLAEMKELISVYGVEEIYFEDDQIIAKQRRSSELFDAIAEQFDIVWDTPNGVSPWLLNDRIIKKMKDSGCYRINIAIESGDQFVLDNIINKPVKLDAIRGIVDSIRKNGLEVGTFLVVGNFSEKYIETIEQIKSSFRFCRKLGVYPHASLLTAYPGSKVLDIAKDKGYLIEEFDWDNMVIQGSQLKTPEWSPNDLEALVRKERLKTRFYLLIRYPVRSLSVYIKRVVSSPVETIGRIIMAFK